MFGVLRINLSQSGTYIMEMIEIVSCVSETSLLRKSEVVDLC